MWALLVIVQDPEAVKRRRYNFKQPKKDIRALYCIAAEKLQKRFSPYHALYVLITALTVVIISESMTPRILNCLKLELNRVGKIALHRNKKAEINLYMRHNAFSFWIFLTTVQ